MLVWATLLLCMQAQVDEDEALALVNKGAVIVDVRLADDYKVRCCCQALLNNSVSRYMRVQCHTALQVLHNREPRQC